MSTRAYRVNSFEYEGQHSFDLWNDEEFLSFIEQENGNYDTEDTGAMLIDLHTEESFIEMPVRVLERFLETFDCLEPGSDYYQIKDDIDWAKSKNLDEIRYWRN